MKRNFTKVKNIYLSNSQVFKNMTWLTVLQFANYLIPLLIIPIVVRALGIEAFGKVSYAQNIISYFTILVNFGFDYSATQDIAINREKHEKINIIFWTVIRFKIILLLLSFVLLAFLYIFFEPTTKDSITYIYAGLINLGFVLFPSWFFQGMENMRLMAIFNFSIKGISAIAIVLLIRHPSDYQLYLLILSLSYIIIGIVALVYILNKYKLYSLKIDKTIRNNIIRKSLPVFLTNSFNTLYFIAGLTIIGLYMTEIEVSIYAGCQKIIMAVIMITIMPLSTAIFPKMSRLFKENDEYAWSFYKKILLVSSILGIVIGFFLFFLAPYIVSILLGKEFISAVPYLRAMFLMPLLVLLGTMLTVQGLYGCQLQRYAPYVSCAAGCVSLVLCLILIPRIGISGAIIAWVGAQISEIMIVSILLKRYKRQLQKCFI